MVARLPPFTDHGCDYQGEKIAEEQVVYFLIKFSIQLLKADTTTRSQGLTDGHVNPFTLSPQFWKESTNSPFSIDWTLWWVHQNFMLVRIEILLTVSVRNQQPNNTGSVCSLCTQWVYDLRLQNNATNSSLSLILNIISQPWWPQS